MDDKLLKEVRYYRFTITLNITKTFNNSHDIEEDIKTFVEKELYLPKLYEIYENIYTHSISIYCCYLNKKDLKYGIKQKMYDYGANIMNNKIKKYKKNIEQLNIIKEEIKNLIN